MDGPWPKDVDPVGLIATTKYPWCANTVTDRPSAIRQHRRRQRQLPFRFQRLDHSSVQHDSGPTATMYKTFA